MGMKDKVSWRKYKAFMQRFEAFKVEQPDGNVKQFLREQAPRMDVEVSVLYKYIHGTVREEWYDRFYAENQPEVPTKREVEGFIVNHPLTRQAWV